MECVEKFHMTCNHSDDTKWEERTHTGQDFKKLKQKKKHRVQLAFICDGSDIFVHCYIYGRARARHVSRSCIINHLESHTFVIWKWNQTKVAQAKKGTCSGVLPITRFHSCTKRRHIECRVYSVHYRSTNNIRNTIFDQKQCNACICTGEGLKHIAYV